MVGDYRIDGLLGEGGHGHVYRAEASGRAYAVKFLDPGLDRFGAREVQVLVTLAQLRLPGVVRFIACGRWPDRERGLFYVVMEYVEGLTLYDYVMLHNPSARKVGELVLSLGRTLIAVQEAGVLHRDLKRENIMVRLPSEEPVVLDFGLAAMTGARSSEGFGPITGTLEYVSPEAWKHARDEDKRYRPTAKDEQWALGVTFYWMLTDLLPFGLREDPFMTRRVLREVPKMPHVINPRVPPELGAICMRLLEKSPENRYPDLRVMCGELRRVMEASAGAENWEVLLGDPHAPECRTTEIDATRLAQDGIELVFSKIKVPRRGRVIKLPEYMAPAPPPVPPPEPQPLSRAEDAAPAPEAAAVVVAVPVPVPVVPDGPNEWRQRAPTAGQMPARRAGSWAMMLALGLVMVPLPVDGPSHPKVLASNHAGTPALGPNGFQPNEEVVPFGAWQVGTPIQKLEIPLQPPESDADAISTRASVVEATLPKDEPDVKNALKKVRKCVGVCCIAGAAGCVSNTTVVRSEPPPPEPCPARTIEQMEKMGIRPRAYFHTKWPGSGWEAGTTVTVREGAVKLKGDREGVSYQWADGFEFEFEGRIFLGSDRVYGVFTKGTTPEGKEFPVCAELVTNGERGLPWEARTADAAVILSFFTIRANDF
ncbi:serine/threonine protein kinase [Hyalangium versicolor]|uniref:serine/threonine protein kinase n=1 Tax=Hyalangium versicolor TaxID=2861190 RepID=UPI001CCFE21C|nr:serine/threonine-protein kinase [Hyalangium versicolor]